VGIRLRTYYRSRHAGITLIDLLVVLVIVTILASYGFMKINKTGDDTLWYQAQRMARDIRHTQVLASTWGKPLKIVSTSTGYSVSCVTAGTAPCNSSPVTDPATGQSFSVTLQYGVTLAYAVTNCSGCATNTVSFDMVGRPLNGSGAVITTTGTVGTYSVSYSGTTVTIALAPVTGFLTVSN
jgi:Tfp pilus assembly protein FimT